MSAMKYSVVSVTGGSLMGCTPDKEASRVLQGFGFTQRHGRPEQLYLGADPGSRQFAVYLTSNEKEFRLVRVDNGTEVLLDRGKVFDFNPPARHIKTSSIAANGEKLANWEFQCLPWQENGHVAPAAIPAASRHPPPHPPPASPKAEAAAGSATVTAPAQSARPVPAAWQIKPAEPAPRASLKPSAANPPPAARAATLGSGEKNLEPILLKIPVARIRRFEEQPRVNFNLRKLEELGTSLQSGQSQSIIVIPVTADPDHDYELIAGERRLRAAKLKGITHLLAVVRRDIKDKTQQLEEAITADLNKESHSRLELSIAFQRLRDANVPLARIMEISGKSLAWVRGHLAFQKLLPELRALLDPPTPKNERLPFQIASVIASVPAEMQQSLCDQIMAEPSKKLRLAIAQQLAREWIPERKGKRKPSKAVEILERMLNRLRGDAVDMRGMDTEVFENFVNHRAPAVVTELLNNIDQISEQLKLAREQILAERKRIA